jgi:hypothetical protein
MINERAGIRRALTAAFLSMFAGAALAAPSHAAHGVARGQETASAATPGEHRAAQDLARSILSRVPAAATGGACAAPTLDSLRAAVSAAIAQTDPPRDVALAAVALARQQTPPAEACVLAALDDTADELDGSGATVDDVGKVRGFTLYMGPLPSSVGRVSTP